MFTVAKTETARDVLLGEGLRMMYTQVIGGSQVWVFEHVEPVVGKYSSRDDIFTTKKLFF